jgi:hypothetical protein
VYFHFHNKLKTHEFPRLQSEAWLGKKLEVFKHSQLHFSGPFHDPITGPSSPQPQEGISLTFSGKVHGDLQVAQLCCHGAAMSLQAW